MPSDRDEARIAVEEWVIANYPHYHTETIEKTEFPGLRLELERLLLKMSNVVKAAKTLEEYVCGSTVTRGE